MDVARMTELHRQSLVALLGLLQLTLKELHAVSVPGTETVSKRLPIPSRM